MADRKIEVKITADTKDLEKGFNQAGKSANKFGGAMGTMAKAGAIGAAVGGVALLAKGLTSSVKAALEAEKAEARFADAMDQVGATAKQRAAAQEQVNKVSRQAALDDEDLSDVYSKLVRTTGSVTKAQEGMALSADIARARNISLEAASKLVEKAMLGNEQAFKKVGLQVDKGTTATEALEQAQKRFGGSAEKYGNTAAGAQEKLGVAFENLQEKVGQKVLPVLQKFTLKLIEVVEWAEKNWPRFAKSIQPVVDALGDVWKVTQTMWEIIKPILEVAIPLAFKLIGTQINIMIEVWKTMAKVVTTIITTILGAVDKFLGGIQAIAEAASHLPFVGDKFRGIADKIGNAREKVRELSRSIQDLNGSKATITLETVYKERHETLPGNPIGRRAIGGPVSKNMPYLIGERGPEIFVPSSAGTVVPNHALRSSSGGVGSMGTQVIQLVVDGKTLAQIVRNQDALYQQRGGTAAFNPV